MFTQTNAWFFTMFFKGNGFAMGYCLSEALRKRNDARLTSAASPAQERHAPQRLPPITQNKPQQDKSADLVGLLLSHSFAQQHF